MIRLNAFPPIVVPGIRVLVVGSLPGARSLAAGEYYAHPSNRFWHLIGAVIGREDMPALAYPDRLAVLLAAGIGLWDTIASATRRGSLDAAIRDARPAPLAQLVAALPQLRAVGFNGAAAARIGRAVLNAAGAIAAEPTAAEPTAAGPHATGPAEPGLALIDLPSSSPAYAAMPFAAKRARWLVLQGCLDAGVRAGPGPAQGCTGAAGGS